MEKVNKSNPKYVFVCGLGRSGTSVLARNVARLENCTGFRNTGAVEDEGQFLQDVYPSDNLFGGAAQFGFDPRTHLTEASPLLTSENSLRLRQSWEQYWDQSKEIRVEKTPGHLLKTRFLQVVFPNSYFIVTRRHPVAVSLANNQKWKLTSAPLHKLFDHWLHCHGLFDEDKRYLERVYELRYEDYIQNPDKYHEEIAGFIGTEVPKRSSVDKFYYVTQWRNPTGLRVPENAMEDVTGAHNQKYFKRWSELLNNSRFSRYHEYLAVTYEPKFSKYGYSLIDGFGVSEERLAKQASPALGGLYRMMAHIHAFGIRLPLQARGYAKRQLRAWLPAPVKALIRHYFQKTSVPKKQSEAVVS
jgi:hypothetical protein